LLIETIRKLDPIKVIQTILAGLVGLNTLSLFPDASFELESIGNVDVLDLFREVPLAAWGQLGMKAGPV
jgi:hypothetical protein